MKAIRLATSDKLHSQNEAGRTNKPKNYMPPYYLMCGINISQYLVYNWWQDYSTYTCTFKLHFQGYESHSSGVYSMWSICQRLAAGRWFSPGTPVSCTNKTDRHKIIEILLKVALNTITLTLHFQGYKIFITFN